MPFNQFNIGKDVVIDVTTQQGTQQFLIVTEFGSKQRTKNVEVHALDGSVRFAELPAGWEGTIHFDRGSEALDIFIATLEANYYGGVPIQTATITETITEVDGTVTQWQYTGVVFVYEDAGQKKGDDKIMQRLGFKASFRKQLV